MRNHKLLRVKESNPPIPIYQYCFLSEDDLAFDDPGSISICNDCGYGNTSKVMLMIYPPTWKCDGCDKYHIT